MIPRNSAAPVASGGRQINHLANRVYAPPTLVANFEDLAVEVQAIRTRCEVDLLGMVMSRPREGWALALLSGLQFSHFAHEDTRGIAAAIDVLYHNRRFDDVGVDFQRGRVIQFIRPLLDHLALRSYWPQHELIHLSRKFCYEPTLIALYVEHLIDLGERIDDAERALRLAYHRLLGRKGAA